MSATSNSLLEVRPLGRDLAMHVTPRHQFHHLVRDQERFTTDLICRISRRAGLFVDVGAHCGFFSLIAASSNSALDVIAVEPTPDTFAVLERNLATLTTDKVTSYQTAISDVVGTKSFGISQKPENCGFYFRPEAPPLRWIDVPTKSLDALLLDRRPCPLVIKIDTQGHELAVVKGMSETLRRFNEISLIVKFNPVMLRAGGNQPAALLEELDRLGFETFMIDDRARQTFRLRPSGDWERLLGEAHSADLYCVRKDRALSLCFFAHTAELGGAERTLLGLIEELITNHGAICCVVVPGQGAFAQALERVGASCIIAQYQWWCAQEQLTGNERGQRIRQGIESVFADIVPQIKKIDPDCIWTMTMVIPWGAMIAGILAKPHVWSVHEYGEKDHDLKFFWPLDQISADIVASSSLVYVVSKGIVAALFPTSPADRLRPFPYSIAVPPASDGDSELEFFKESKSIKLGVFASLHPAKGQEDAVLALAQLVARGHNVELLLAGLTADQSYRERLVALGRKLKVAERIHFSGFLDDPYRAMRSCDIIVVCSRNEAFGRVAVEAMLLKKAVVYAAAGGLLESMIDGQTGLSYPPADIESLVAGLEELIGNPERRTAIGEFARRHAIARFGRGAGGREIFGTLLELRSQAAPKVLAPGLLEDNVFSTMADSITELRRTTVERSELRIELHRTTVEREELRAELSRVSAELSRVSEARDHWRADAGELRTSREEVRARLKETQAELRQWQDQGRALNNLATYASERYAAANLAGLAKPVGFGVRLFRRVRSKLRLPSSVPSRAYYAVRNSIFFDAAFYSNEYPDVEATGTDPVLHYILHGGFEGRNPGPYFSSSKYLDENPDVVAAGVNPLVHYELNGRRERRALPLMDLSSST